MKKDSKFIMEFAKLGNSYSASVVLDILSTYFAEELLKDFPIFAGNIMNTSINGEDWEAYSDGVIDLLKGKYEFLFDSPKYLKEIKDMLLGSSSKDELISKIRTKIASRLNFKLFDLDKLGISDEVKQWIRIKLIKWMRKKKLIRLSKNDRSLLSRKNTIFSELNAVLGLSVHEQLGAVMNDYLQSTVFPSLLELEPENINNAIMINTIHDWVNKTWEYLKSNFFQRSDVIDDFTNHFSLKKVKSYIQSGDLKIEPIVLGRIVLIPTNKDHFIVSVYSPQDLIATIFQGKLPETFLSLVLDSVDKLI